MSIGARYDMDMTMIADDDRRRKLVFSIKADLQMLGQIDNSLESLNNKIEALSKCPRDWSGDF